ncbi:MAG TPA: cytochrome c peroxidase [Chitinophaga sp.]|uniref:cytochrome-c peroxidase n=1 Tax=Chitinophaga sp. TaxID=1869181 RepID=UPI002C47BD07|nr:cytochrome c peroxidase [Chitinophaga sp.]HVI49501.1 cytochrome c peroxidase [Chitinophaga sp.]
MTIKAAWIRYGILIFFTSGLLIQSCSKADKPIPEDHTGGTGQPPGTGGTSDVPSLPLMLYDYVHTSVEMPSYIFNIINTTTDMDNTPGGNAITNEGATLGRVLFYDKKLSINNTISCASCHHQDKAFTDGTTRSKGFGGQLTRRNAMSTVNLRFFMAKKMFWDMRAGNLEQQTLMPVLDKVEMGMPSLTVLEEKLSKVSYYPELFRAAFGTTQVTSERISRALSQFLRSIVSFRSRYDEGMRNNFADFTPEEIRGKRFVTGLHCAECHSDLNHIFPNGGMAPMLPAENSGLNDKNFGSNNGLELNYTDKGIGEITGKDIDQGTFKMPSLRNIELTAPYMHDGRFATLEEVINHYAGNVKNGPNTGGQLPPHGFTFSDQDKKDIIAFLRTLTDRKLTADPRYADPFVK